MKLWHLFLLLSALLWPHRVLAQGNGALDLGLADAPISLLDDSVIASDGAIEPSFPSARAFVGVGGSYTSVRLDQHLNVSNRTVYSDYWGRASADWLGSETPLHSTQLTFAPAVQLGFVDEVGYAGWFGGAKLTYRYLGVTFTDPYFMAPIMIVGTSPEGYLTPGTFYGGNFTGSAQTTVNHEIAIIPFAARPLGTSGQFYLGGGPVVFTTQSRIDQLRGHVQAYGDPPASFSGSQWMWGGAAQLGIVYYASPACFLDVSYDIMVTGHYTQHFASSKTWTRNWDTETSVLRVDTFQQIMAQSLTATLNVLF
jgi:hypothetical protein